MKASVALVALLSTGGLVGCHLQLPFAADCGMTFPDHHLLTLGGLSSPVVIACCGDARHYPVAQADNNAAMDVTLQAASATNGGPIPGLRLSVAIDHCEAARQGDCAPVADQTTPSKAAGDYAQASVADASVSGRNIRLAITVTNDQPIQGALSLDVTQGHSCPAW
jgi:hypothetical protein